MQVRGSGILLPIFSLPSNYGIGTMGSEAKRFVDFLEKAGQTYWQILPVGQTSYGDSPYQSFSVYAGNPYFIDFDLLKEDGLLEGYEYRYGFWGEKVDSIDYALLYKKRYEVLKTAFGRFNRETEDFKAFLEKEGEWIYDYGLFMSLKMAHDGKGWYEWSDGLRLREEASLTEAREMYEDQIMFWAFLQYEFYKQWNDLRTYANEKGIKIIGDIPIYVAYDSVDVWCHPEYFELDEERRQVNVAGCPPDGFSADGQLWGNPLYNWDYMKEENYAWWVKRLTSSQVLYDIVRIDHFRGFESYYSIPAEDDHAKNGVWRKGPGIGLFEAIREQMGEVEVIAEDLGYLTPEVEEMLAASGFPGMKLLQFAFDSREGGNYLPHHYVKNSVAYIGTHDNDTALGWLYTADWNDVQYMRTYFDFDEQGWDDGGKKKLVWQLIRKVMATVCNTAIISMQDYLCLNSDARTNTPSTLGGNWTWRMKKDGMSDELAAAILHITKLYQR
ncbi:MAG: 4-alpha-glucanotransferase [Lachnospiraceae bacterium]|nr:4-alpha-glucanotransferase [Lachnospiraceae bacterium]